MPEQLRVTKSSSGIEQDDTETELGSARVRVAGPEIVPCVRLFAADVMVARPCGLGSKCEEVKTPLVELSFDYGGTRIRASDPATRVLRADGSDLIASPRDASFEARARCILERLGAVDLECLDDIAVPADCEADYVVRVDGDAHAFCAFTARAVPELRAQGFRVDIDASYPFRTVDREVPWFGAVLPQEELPGWFTLELGVELEGGEKIDLLPLIVELIGEAEDEDGLRAMLRRARSSFAMRVSDTHHVTVSQDRLRALVHVVLELYQGGGARRTETDAITFPGVRAAALADLDAVFTRDGAKLAWNDPDLVVDRARKLASATARSTEIAPPATLKAELRPYQKSGVAFLQHLREEGIGGVLADDMGLGKTLQTIAHLCIEKDEGRLESPALIVAPTSLVGNWARELAKFAPHLRVTVLHGSSRHARYDAIPRSDVVITTYPLVVRDEEKLAQEQFYLVVLDEAQAIKNVRSQAHRAIRSIQTEHRLCLSGTPLENHLGELWALFDFLNPGLLGDELCFRRWYRQPIEQQGDEERLAALREQVAPFILRRVKRDVAKELPPKTELLRAVEITGAQRDLYEHIRVAAHADVRKAIRSKGFAGSTIHILDALMKLRQVCCDPRLVAMDAARGVLESAKLESLLELLERQREGGHRVLVFSQFASMLKLISQALVERGITHLALTGQTRDRQSVVDAFESGMADVFLISLKAGGTGLNLVSADTVVHYDQWWNPAAQAQATDRAYRIGQQRPVFVYNLFVSGSVEERVMRLQQKKRWLSSSVLGDEVPAPVLNEHDVDALFAPLEDR